MTRFWYISALVHLFEETFVKEDVRIWDLHDQSKNWSSDLESDCDRKTFQIPTGIEVYAERK